MRLIYSLWDATIRSSPKILNSGFNSFGAVGTVDWMVGNIFLSFREVMFSDTRVRYWT